MSGFRTQDGGQWLKVACFLKRDMPIVVVQMGFTLLRANHVGLILNDEITVVDFLELS